MKFQLVALSYYEQMITNNPFKCIDLPYSEFVLKAFANHYSNAVQIIGFGIHLKAFANHYSNAVQIIGFGIHKLKYCGRRRKYWFPAILYNSTLTLKAILGLFAFDNSE